MFDVVRLCTSQTTLSWIQAKLYSISGGWLALFAALPMVNPDCPDNTKLEGSQVSISPQVNYLRLHLLFLIS